VNLTKKGVNLKFSFAEWACGFGTMIKKYRPKKTCPLCLCNKGTEKKQKRELYVKTCN
jgi:hypothetical protein